MNYLEVGIDQTGTSSSITGSGTANTLSMFTSANTIGNSVITQNSAGTALNFGVTGATAGVVTPFTFPQPVTTGVTANTEAVGFSAGGGSVQFTVGTVATQRQTYFASTTYTGTLAPTVLTNAYGVYVESPTASTNVTISNNWSIGTSGNVSIGGNASIKGTGGNGFLNLVAQNVSVAQPSSNGLNLSSGNGGALTWIQKGGLSPAFSGAFNLNTLSSNHQWELYDFSGDVGIFSTTFGAPSDSYGNMIFSDASIVGAMTWDGNIPFVYDITNARLGIGTNAPSATFHIATNTTISGATTSFLYAPQGNTGQTASAEISGVTFTLGTRQWATGAIATQREFLISAPTYSFVGASTITNAYSLYISAPISSTNATITNKWALGLSGSLKMVTGRVVEAEGADVPSANNLVLGTDGNVFSITGTTQINLISNLGWQNGARITLIFFQSLTVKHGQTTSGTNITILLSGAADFSATANDTLQLVLNNNGGSQQWSEVSRTVI